MAYSVELIRSKRRSLSLELKRDGTILVRAPLRMSRERIEGYGQQRPYTRILSH